MKNSIKENIDQETNIEKSSLWDKVKNALKYAPIIGTAAGIGIATALSMGIVPGIIATSATGLGMLSGVIKNTESKKLPIPDDALKNLIINRRQQDVMRIIKNQDNSLSEYRIRKLLTNFYNDKCDNANSFREAKTNLLKELSYDINLLNSIRNKNSRGGRISFIEKMIKQFPKDYLGSIEDLSQVLLNDRQGLDDFFTDGGMYPTPHVLHKMEQNIRKIINRDLRSALLNELQTYKNDHRGIYLSKQNKFEIGITMMCERLLGVKFFECKEGTLEWLRNRHGDYIDLDGYAELEIYGISRKIAFEINPEDTHSDQRTIENDEDKIKRCRENKVLLIVLSKDLIENGDPQAYIREQIENWIGKELPKTPKLTIDYINELIGRGDIHFL